MNVIVAFLFNLALMWMLFYVKEQKPCDKK